MRCLIIDDNVDSRDGYAEYLRAFGFDVSTLEGATRALDRIRRWLPDIILLDLRMPRLDGWAFLRLLRGDPAGCTVPVVAVSACAYAEDRTRAELAGCDAFLSKPCTPDVVLACIKKLVGTTAAT
ncbi:MAG: response regulator [Acidobacteria bacterium]|nr:MAG: response regulator [Acidobacteriota bacterium]